MTTYREQMWEIDKRQMDEELSCSDDLRLVDEPWGLDLPQWDIIHVPTDKAYFITWSDERWKVYYAEDMAHIKRSSFHHVAVETIRKHAAGDLARGQR